MSEPIPTTTESSPLSSIIVRIIADHIHAIEALAATFANSLDYIMLHTSYENAINLARTLHSSENLTNRFAMLAAENEDLALERDAAITDCNALTTQVTQLEAQLMQTLTLATATTNPSPAGCKGQTDPKMFTRDDRSKLRSFVAVLHLYLMDHPREFPNEQSKL
jgi:hypothetical protein